MILSKPDIQQRLNSEEGLKIDPFPKEASIGPVSVNLRLGRKFTTFQAAESTKHNATIRVTPSVFQSEYLWDHQEDVDSFDLPSGGFVLAQTLETISMPNDLMVLLKAGVAGHEWVSVCISQLQKSTLDS